MATGVTEGGGRPVAALALDLADQFQVAVAALEPCLPLCSRNLALQRRLRLVAGTATADFGCVFQRLCRNGSDVGTATATATASGEHHDTTRGEIVRVISPS